MAASNADHTVLAVHAHRITMAIDAEARATEHRHQIEAEAAAADFPIKVWRRALGMLRSHPAEVEALERHTGLVLMAVRAGVYEDLVAVDTITEQSPAERRQRIIDEGYHAAIVGRAADSSGYSKPIDQGAFAEGWHAFRLDLAAFEARRAVELASGALSHDAPGRNLMPHPASEAA